MEMSGNRHPFRVGPVREAYWGTLGPIITSALRGWAREEKSREGRIEKKGTVQQGSHTSPHCGFIILACDLSEVPRLLQNLQFVSTQDAVNQLRLYAA